MKNSRFRSSLLWWDMRKNRVVTGRWTWFALLVAALAVGAVDMRASARALAGPLGSVTGESDSTDPKLSEPETDASTSATPADGNERSFQVESLRGQVVWYEEALQQRLGIQTVPEAKQRVLALATKDDKLIPIIEDLRGRAFRTDARLREMEVELMVRRYEATPSVQILRVYQWKDGRKFQVDYWCDICAIVMFEDGPCSCCQDHNRLRTRLVEK